MPVVGDGAGRQRCEKHDLVVLFGEVGDTGRRDLPSDSGVGPMVFVPGQEVGTGGSARSPSVLDHAAGRAKSSGRGEWGVPVDREGLLGLGADFAIHTGTRRPSPVSSTRRGVSVVTDVPGQHT